MKKILIIGNNGQVGWELQRTIPLLGAVTSVDFPQIDLSKPDSITACIRENEPDIIINSAAYTAVDMAESEPEMAMAVNGTAPGIIAEEAKKLGALLIHYSTDYIFDGKKGSPYLEEDTPNPLNVYGRSKLAGEEAIRSSCTPHFILRSSWIYGSRGKNFLLTMIRLAKERDEIKVVNDQTGAPTWSRIVAEATAQILAKALLMVNSGSRDFKELNGTYNITAGGKTTWYEFADAIIKGVSISLNNKLLRLIPVTTVEYNAPAKRPFYSVMSNEKVKRDFGIIQISWEAALKLCIEDALWWKENGEKL